MMMDREKSEYLTLNVQEKMFRASLNFTLMMRVHILLVGKVLENGDNSHIDL